MPSSRKRAAAPARQEPTESLGHHDASLQEKWLNDADIEDILSDVGTFPVALDRKQLLHDLNGAWNFYKYHKKETSKGHRTALLKHTNRVINAASELSKILDRSNEAADDLGKFAAQALLPLDDLQIRLGRLTSLAGALHRAYSSSVPPTAFGLTPSDFFLGYDLPRIFMKHFKRKAGESRASDGKGPPTGPFIRFAVGVSTALERPYSAETIADALTNKKSSLRSRYGQLTHR
jgi:hypothetical protein